MAALPVAAIGLRPASAQQQAPSPQAPSPQAATEAKPDLFSQVFGQRRQSRARRLDLPVLMAGRELGLVAAVISGDPEAATVDLMALAGLLGEIAQDGALERLRAAAGEDGLGRPADLPEDGIQVAVDGGNLQIEVTVPPALRRRVRLDVQRRGELARGFILIPPADVSAYVNVRGALEYLDGFGGDRDGRGPLAVSFEPAVNIHGWAIEGEAFYREDADERWARGPFRLIRDRPDASLRFIAGDFALPVDGLQSSRAIGGLSLTRNFSLQPYRNIQPSGQREFILEAPSTVEVLVNGRPVRSFRLEPGPYDIANLPGTSGANDVALRIVDSFGRQQIVEFPFFFDSQLLSPGIQQFGYSFGFPYSIRRDIFRYDTESPVFSGYHRMGLTDRLTLGGGMQISAEQQNFSGEVLFTTPYGTFALLPAGSFAGANGYTLTARYRNYMRGEQIWKNRTLTAQVSWRDNTWSSFGSQGTGNDVAFDASVRLSQPITSDLVATLGARWRESRTEAFDDSYAVDLSLRRRIGLGDSLDVTLTHERDPQGEESTGVFAALRFSFSDGRQGLGLSADTITRERRLDWRYQSLRPVDSLSVSLDALNRPGGNRLQGSAAYTHQRFLVSARHDLVDRVLGEEDVLENRTQINLSTALAFADGHVALTRPITNSFAIIVPHPRLDGQLVGVDPVAGTYLSRTDWLGPPVVPNISPYLIRPLLLDVPDVPLGYDIGNDRPGVEPGYRTGTLVPIGTDAAVSLDGVLMLPDGQAAALLSGELRPVGADAAVEPVPFFTNRRGRFRVEAVRPGAWELFVFGVDAATIPVTVAPEAEGIIELGTVRLQAR